MGLSRFGIVAVFLSLASFVGDGAGEMSLLALAARALAAWGLLIPLQIPLHILEPCMRLNLCDSMCIAQAFLLILRK